MKEEDGWNKAKQASPLSNVLSRPWLGGRGGLRGEKKGGQDYPLPERLLGGSKRTLR